MWCRIKDQLCRSTSSYLNLRRSSVRLFEVRTGERPSVGSSWRIDEGARISISSGCRSHGWKQQDQGGKFYCNMNEKSFIEAIALVFAWTIIQKTFISKLFWSTPRAVNGSEDDPEALEKLKDEQANLQIVKDYTNNEEWMRVKDDMFMPPGSSKTDALPFTRKVLLGKDKVRVVPEVFIKKDFSESVTIIKVGDDLCGHPGVVHGGMVATIYDNSMALIAYSNISQKIAYTANLNINFRSPMPSRKYILFKSKLLKVEGRKIYVQCVSTDLNEKAVYSDATSLFITPKPGVKSYIVTKLMPSY